MFFQSPLNGDQKSNKTSRNYTKLRMLPQLLLLTVSLLITTTYSVVIRLPSLPRVSSKSLANEGGGSHRSNAFSKCQLLSRNSHGASKHRLSATCDDQTPPSSVNDHSSGSSENGYSPPRSSFVRDKTMFDPLAGFDDEDFMNDDQDDDINTNVDSMCSSYSSSTCHLSSQQHHGSDEERSKFFIALENGCTMVIQDLLKHQAGDANWISLHGESALNVALRMDHVEMVRLLIRYGARTDVFDSSGQTPLTLAVLKHETKSVERLLEAGVDVDLKNKFQENALMLASLYGYDDIAQVLLKYGANVNVKNGDDETPLMHAARNGRADIVQLLLEQKYIVVNAQNWFGKSSLMFAVKARSFDSVRLLLKHGGDIFLKASNGLDVIDLACQREMWDILDLFRARLRLPHSHIFCS